MTDQAAALKLQAYLDGELSSTDAKAVAELLDRDAGARALFQELSRTKSLLAGNEPNPKVPESREFYWSRIAREIQRQDAAGAVPAIKGATFVWLRWLAPAGALALLILTLTLTLRSPSQRGWVALAEGHEIETPLEETSSFTFRSESAGMTVVWVDTHPN